MNGMTDRRGLVRSALLDLFRTAPAPLQWVILAAGADPMPAEILPLVPDKVSHVFEIGDASMNEKKRRYIAADPQLARRITCITMDIASPRLLEDLMIIYALDPVLPTVVQVEGSGDRPAADVIRGILEAFKTPNGQNRSLCSHDGGIIVEKL